MRLAFGADDVYSSQHPDAWSFVASHRYKVNRERAEKKCEVVKMRTVSVYGHKEQKEIARG